MNNQLIEKVILSNNDNCPTFTYKNPLLDKNVAAALSKSFVKLLNMSSENSNVNNNLRLSILDNIRRLCQFEPEGHAKVDEGFTELLKRFYELQLQNVTENTTDKQLDAFLLRKMKEVDLNPTFESAVNPEIIQSLLNLNENGVYLCTLTNNIINWNTVKFMYDPILKELWNELKEDVKQDEVAMKLLDDVSIKMKPKIEKLLLETSLKVLHAAPESTIADDFSSDNALLELVKTCGKSANCFQICCGVLNLLFILTNFDSKLLKFINTFVRNVKENCPLLSFSVLYPVHLSNMALMLDIDINNMECFKEQYVEYTLKHLADIHKQSDNDFVLLLTHFPDWFEIYYQNESNN